MSAFHARILASDALFFDGDCEFIVVPCTDGAMGILSHHSNMIAAVVPGELRFRLTHRREEGVDVSRKKAHPHPGNAEQEKAELPPAHAQGSHQ